ncbi:hypothetical protein HGG75_18255 [Ochrobactrum pseudogrignonense]|nr:hypothetical protein [Brucella pseudogrignonensis]
MENDHALNFKAFIISIIAILIGFSSPAFAGVVSCNIVPLEGTGALSKTVTRPAWRIKPELPASGDFPGIRLQSRRSFISLIALTIPRVNHCLEFHQTFLFSN